MLRLESDKILNNVFFSSDSSDMVVMEAVMEVMVVVTTNVIKLFWNQIRKPEPHQLPNEVDLSHTSMQKIHSF